MTRDRITVEREYEGERCGYECEHLSTIDEPHCDHFRQSLESEQDGSPDEGGNILYYRCPACISTPGLPQPQDAVLRQAIKTVSGVIAEIQHDIDRTNAMTTRPIEAIYVHVSGVDALVAGFRTLLRAVQAPQLTAERLEAIREVVEWDGYDSEGEPAVWLDRIRAAFPELAAGK